MYSKTELTEKNMKEITSEQYAEKILEIAYHDFPLVHPKETVLRVINALLLEYAALKQQESDVVDLAKHDWKLLNDFKTSVYEYLMRPPFNLEHAQHGIACSKLGDVVHEFWNKRHPNIKK